MFSNGWREVSFLYCQRFYLKFSSPKKKGIVKGKSNTECNKERQKDMGVLSVDPR